MPDDLLLVRMATEADAPALLAIYAPYVAHTTVSFEMTVPCLDEFRGRIRKYGEGWAWLVAERDGGPLGYAYGSPHRERAAYRWSVETSAYVAPTAQRQGVGRTLYLALFEVLANRGYCNAYAGIALPNDPSIALHSGVGFEPVGVFRAAGRKFGAWRDIASYQRTLRDQPPHE